MYSRLGRNLAKQEPGVLRHAGRDRLIYGMYVGLNGSHRANLAARCNCDLKRHRSSMAVTDGSNQRLEADARNIAVLAMRARREQKKNAWPKEVSHAGSNA
jgi:hypothetical protein